MSEKGVNIPITASTDTKPVAALENSLKALKKELASAKKEFAASAPKSAEWDAASVKVKALSEQVKAAAEPLKSLKKSASDAAGSKNASGMLLFGQALEDAQYGLRGVMNNIPGVVMSMGLGAGAAGVLQVALVAVSQVLDLLSKRSDEMKGKPLLGEMTIDEAVMEHMRLFTEHLERQKEAVQDRNDSLRQTNEAVAEAMKAEKALIDFRRQVEDEDFVSTGDPVLDIAAKRDIQLQRTAEDAAMRNRERALKLTNEMAVQGNREGNFKQLSSEESAQAIKVAQLKQRAALESALAFAMNPTMKAPGGVAAGDGSLLESLSAGVLSSIPGLSGLLAGNKRMDGAQIANLKQKLEGLPTLPGFEPTGDAKADDAKRRELFAQEQQRLLDLRRAREDAGRDVDTGFRSLQTTKQTVAGDAALDEAKTQRTEELIRRRAEAEMQRQQQAEAQIPSSTSDAVKAPDITSANKQLNGLAERAGDGQTQAKIGGLYSAVNDGKGDTSKELGVIREFAGRIGGNAEQNKAALDQALSKMEALQTDGSRMQQTLANLMEGLIGNQRALAAMLQGMAGEVSNVKQQLDSIRR